MESTPHSNGSAPVKIQHSSPCAGGSAVGCIQHTVTKFDTLAGVAIKYGVEVADIKKTNGLTSDLQMFARKSLQIPLPGRHPPSPIMPNSYRAQGQTSSEMLPPHRRYSDSFSSIKSLKLSSSPQQDISLSINTLRGYYGLTPNAVNGVGVEMTRTSNPLPLGLHRKSKSEANGFSEMCGMDEKGGGSDKSIEKLVRRRKSEVDANDHIPEMPPKLDNDSVGFGKGLALRGNRTSTDSEVGDSIMVQAFSGVRKSSSAPSFQHSETTIINNNNNTSSSSTTTSSFWPISMLNFTASTAAIASPIFDGLPKPISGRKNKAARD